MAQTTSLSNWACDCCTSNHKYVDWKCELLFKPRSSAKRLVQLMDSGQSVLRCFFLPILIAICCSYICRLEHLNRNWNMIMTSTISVANVFLAKLIIISILILFAQCLFIGLYWLIGTLFSLPGLFPLETIEWTIRGWYASISISALQLGLSLRIRSFAIPIGISLCGVFIGLGMYIGKFGMLFPFSLLNIGMSVMSQDKLTTVQNFLFWMINMAFVIIFALRSIKRLKNRDIISS